MSERYLANENFQASVVHWLRAPGDDVVYAAEQYVGASDESLFRAAADQGRIVLTFDRDFGELVFHRGAGRVRGVVLFRLNNRTRTLVGETIREFFESAPTLEGFFTVVSPGQFRQAPLGRIGVK